jgi:hypothetical protein
LTRAQSKRWKMPAAAAAGAPRCENGAAYARGARRRPRVKGRWRWPAQAGKRGATRGDADVLPPPTARQRPSARRAPFPPHLSPLWARRSVPREGRKGARPPSGANRSCTRGAPVSGPATAALPPVHRQRTPGRNRVLAHPAGCRCYRCCHCGCCRRCRCRLPGLATRPRPRRLRVRARMTAVPAVGRQAALSQAGRPPRATAPTRPRPRAASTVTPPTPTLAPRRSTGPVGRSTRRKGGGWPQPRQMRQCWRPRWMSWSCGGLWPLHWRRRTRCAAP